MIVLSTVSNDKVWGTDRLYKYSGNKNIKKIGSVFSLSGIKDLSTKIISGDENGDLYNAVKNDSSKFGVPEGYDYPIIISFTAGDEDLSIQVHPTDEYAKKHEEKNIGKSEAWYFIEEPDNGWIYAETSITNKNEIRNRILEKDYESVINKVNVEKYDIAYIESGTLHALTKGSLVYEIQQSTDITYRLYDYDRLDASGEKRELHLEDGIATINSSNTVKVEKFEDDKVYKYKPFELYRTNLEKSYTNDKEIAQAITVTKGDMKIDNIEIKQGMSILVLPQETVNIEKPAEEVVIATPNLYFND